MVPYLVSVFEKQTISNLVKECFGYEFPDIFKKIQIDYIYKYLTDLGAVSVLLEFNYIDKDFLEDYARYYVKRFGSDGHRCARLHFFSKEIDHAAISSLLAGDGGEEGLKDLQCNYLGFVVIKPLPKTFIGKTCLRLSNESFDNSGDIKKRLARKYSVDLFGLPLFVHSIAFQEQDKVVAACATTAIWASLHALPWRSVRGIPSCSEITTNAINHIADSSNSFPSKELSNKQILRALDFEGLRHHSEPIFKALSAFEEIIRIQIDSGVPLILGGVVYKVNGGAVELQAGHAISILGYRKTQEEFALYVHDDRLGPFARASVINVDKYGIDSVSAEWGLAFRNKNNDGEWEDFHEILVPDIVIVPADKKARLPYVFSARTCQAVVGQFNASLVPQSEELQGALTYKIRLSEISSIRSDVLSSNYRNAIVDDVSGVENSVALAQWKKHRIEFLTQAFARLQWDAQFFFQGNPIFRLFIDATDIPQGDAVSAIYRDDMLGSGFVLDILRDVKIVDDGVEDVVDMTFYESFLRKLKVKREELSEHLDTTYGEVRAPKYLKPAEYLDGNIHENSTAKRFYEYLNIPLAEAFPTLASGQVEYLIWAVAHDGVLLMGQELESRGHPSLTGFKPARIAGELRASGSKCWVLNSKSGRYSGDYNNSEELLENACRRFSGLFPGESFTIQPQPW
jgi:hypothetical protein